MPEIIIRNANDLERIRGALHGMDFTKPKKVIIKDEAFADCGLAARGRRA